MRAGHYSGVIYRFITTLLEGKQPVIYGDGQQTRDFIYVYDVAYANLKGLRSNYVGVLNIGSGREVSINEVYNLITRILGINMKPSKRPPRPGDVRRSVADITKAKEVLNWIPKTDLKEGLKQTITYYKNLTGIKR